MKLAAPPSHWADLTNSNPLAERTVKWVQTFFCTTKTSNSSLEQKCSYLIKKKKCVGIVKLICLQTFWVLSHLDRVALFPNRWFFFFVKKSICIFLLWAVLLPHCVSGPERTPSHGFPNTLTSPPHCGTASRQQENLPDVRANSPDVGEVKEWTSSYQGYLFRLPIDSLRGLNAVEPKPPPPGF